MDQICLCEAKERDASLLLGEFNLIDIQKILDYLPKNQFDVIVSGVFLRDVIAKDKNWWMVTGIISGSRNKYMPSKYQRRRIKKQ